ncbi:hypothetical protein GWN91_06570, partial [Candidatus Saccharibacteria bacterium]|nr:hypothetical protein [Candidatus Saccharibacteria bacterium]NIW80259.1 hypothetical protein [Calditrichia bacterium]
ANDFDVNNFLFQLQTKYNQVIEGFQGIPCNFERELMRNEKGTATKTSLAGGRVKLSGTTYGLLKKRSMREKRPARAVLVLC